MNVGSASASSRWPQKHYITLWVGTGEGGRETARASDERRKGRKKIYVELMTALRGVAKKEGDLRRIEFGITPAGIKIAQTKKTRKQFFRAKINRPFTKAVYQELDDT